MSESEAPGSPGPARLVAGRYLLVRELGRGGMGTVWLAEDQLVRRQAAVKELRPQPGLAGDDLATFRQRALQEAASAARIHHQNAVSLYDVLPPTAGDDAVYLIMEYIDGPNLAQVIRRDGALPDPAVAGYGLQLLDVLEAAHGLGVVHRDVKPANILIGADGKAKLTDFGIAHVADEARLTRSGVMGTRAYMAPELFDEAPVITPAADLWSLGATLYAAVTGRSPFERDSTAATLRAIHLDDVPVPACSAPLAAAITSLLQRDRAKRATVSQARAKLAQAAAKPAASRAPSGRRSAFQTPDGPAADGRHPTWAQDTSTVTRSTPPTAGSAASPGAKASAADAKTPAYASLIPEVDTSPTPATLRWRREKVITGAVLAILLLGVLVKIHLDSNSGPPALPSQVRAVLTDNSDGNGIGSFAFTSDGRDVATSGEPFNDARLWDAATGKQVTSLSPGDAYTPVTVTPDGSAFAYGTVGQVKLVGTASHAVTRVLTVDSSPELTTIAISPDGRMLAVGGMDGPQVNLFNLTSGSGSPAVTLTDAAAGSAEIDFIAFSPDDSMLAAVDDNTGEVFLWNVAKRTLIATFTTRRVASGGCDCSGWIAFSPDSRTLAISEPAKGSVLFWNIPERKPSGAIPVAQPASPAVIAFSPDGKTFATGSGLGDITVWDLATGKQVSAFTMPAVVSAIAFSPDGGTLATGDEEGQAYLWSLTGS